MQIKCPVLPGLLGFTFKTLHVGLGMAQNQLLLLLSCLNFVSTLSAASPRAWGQLQKWLGASPWGVRDCWVVDDIWEKPGGDI